MSSEVLDITAGPSQAVTLMRDTWMSGNIPGQNKKEKKLIHRGEAMPSGNAVLHGGFKGKCEQGVHVTSWHKYKCRLNPFMLFVMTTDSARCSNCCVDFLIHTETATHLHKQPGTDY